MLSFGRLIFRHGFVDQDAQTELTAPLSADSPEHFAVNWQAATLGLFAQQVSH